jgi:hypothetical protein
MGVGPMDRGMRLSELEIRIEVITVDEILWVEDRDATGVTTLKQKAWHTLKEPRGEQTWNDQLLQ